MCLESPERDAAKIHDAKNSITEIWGIVGRVEFGGILDKMETWVN